MNKRIKLRKFPYPYRCIFSVCNDIDSMSPDQFVDLHSFLNEEQIQTAYGKSLGLDIGDSFWLFNQNPYEKNQMTYFNNLNTSEAKDKDLILFYYKRGILDVLHTYGDFNYNPTFKRVTAIDALKELKQKHINLSVWVNHGSQHNLQNIIIGLGDTPFYESASGQKYTIPEYHADLIKEFGIKFYWIDELTSIIGQERKFSIFEYFLNLQSLSLKKKWAYIGIALLARPLRRSSFFLRKLEDLLGKRFVAALQKNQLLRVRTLKDGQRILSFVRYGDHTLATPGKLENILNDDVLQKLIKKEGYMILYTHLGKINCDNKNKTAIKNAFEKVKSYSERKKILVCKTSDLLWYNLITTGLKWHVEDNSIIIDAVENEVEGSFFPKIENLKGLTFYTPIPDKTDIYIQNNCGRQKIENLQINENDHTGLTSISIPWYLKSAQ